MNLFGPPFSRFRKILWLVCFVMALVHAPGCFIDGIAPDKVIEHAVAVTINLFACWLSFDTTWEKKPEDEK